MSKQYIMPSERKFLHDLILSIHTNPAVNLGRLNPDLAAYLVELQRQGIVAEADIENPKQLLATLRSFRDTTYTDGDILSASAPVLYPSETTETFQTVASFVRDYVRKEAGTKSVLQILYDVYAREDVQRVCGNAIWLINRQIEIALSAYIQQHQDETYTFVTIGQKETF